MRVIVLMIGILACLASGAYARPIKVLIPPPYVSTRSNHIHIVGRTGADEVIILNNDVIYRTVEVKDSVFHAVAELGYGLNEIHLKPAYQIMPENGDTETRVEVLSSPHLTGRMKSLYPAYAFHTEILEAGCTSCHDKESAYLAFDDSLSSCRECHVEFSDRTLLHVNLKNEGCATCHQNNSGSTSTAETVGLRQNPCYDCHADKIGKFDKEFIHGPVAGGSCSVCHDPHGSSHEFSLKNDQEVLCFSCHEFYREFRLWPLQHVPFRDGKCGVCHDPHATNNRWTLTKSSETLCLKCHSPEDGSMEFHNHPYNIKPKNKKLLLQLSESGRLECISCHNPHASQSEHLLRTDQKNACLGCHEDKK